MGKINKIRILNLWVCISFASVMFSLATTPTCVAQSSDLKSNFNNTEYNAQLHDMIVEINKLNDDVKHGKITQETANKTAASLIDDPRYNQVKLKKQIVEKNHEILLRNHRPPIPNEILNGTNIFSKNTRNSANLLSTVELYPTINYMEVYKDGWGVGKNVATMHEATPSDPDQYMRIAAQSEAIGSYYADGYMYTYFFPSSGNAVVGVDFDWTGGCAFPDDCTIDFVLWKLVQIGTEWQWVEVGDDTPVSLTGYTGTNGPNDASGSISTYLDSDHLYCFALEVHTKASAIYPESILSFANFGFEAIGGTPMVKWQQGKVSYYQ